MRPLRLLDICEDDWCVLVCSDADDCSHLSLEASDEKGPDPMKKTAKKKAARKAAPKKAARKAAPKKAARKVPRKAAPRKAARKAPRKAAPRKAPGLPVVQVVDTHVVKRAPAK